MERVDDVDQAASFIGSATPRRSTRTLDANVKIPRRVLLASRWLALGRLTFTLLLILSGHPQAGLELGYKAALISDFPASLLYFGPASGPILAAVVGPIWWFVLPIVVWWLIAGRRPTRHPK